MTALRELASVDFAPALSRRVRGAVAHPLGVLLLAAAVALLCGLAVHPRVFALAGGLLAVAAAGACWPWVTARGATASVAFGAERASEGESVEVSVTVANHLPWPALGLGARGGLGAGDALLARLPAVPARSELTARWDFVPPARGDYPAGAPRVVTGFPFGVREAGREARPANRLVVWPRTFPVGPPPASGGEEVADGNVARGKVGSTGEVLGVRPYRRGDSPRRVHWPQSAKHDRLMVCELQSNTRPAVMVVLDADPASHTPGPDGSREWAVRVAASFIKGWLDEGAQVGAAWGGAFFPPASGRSQMVRVLDALARLPDDTSMTFAELLRSPAVRGARAGVTVAVSSDAAPAPPGVRMVLLDRAGFGGSPSAGGAARPWLTIPSADRVPARLKGGWSKARHGS